MGFDKRTLVLPAGTVFEERTIVTKGDLILGNHVRCGFGLRTEGRVFAGQGAEVDGDIWCTGDVRMDQSCHIQGGIEGGADVFLGERCFVQGDLALEGDLDVGDDVRIGGQLKARGWVNKRNPVPLVIYLFIYLLELLRMGQSEEVERILKDLEEADDAEIAVDEVYLFIPDDCEIGLQESRVKGGLRTGDEVRILGNLVVEGDVELGAATRLHGALRADGDVTLLPGAEVQGSLKATGAVVVGHGCQVLGDLEADRVEMYPSATVDGKVLAEGGVRFCTEEQMAAGRTAEQKVAESEEGKAADLVDLLS